MTDRLPSSRTATLQRVIPIGLALAACLGGATLWAHGDEPATPAEAAVRYRHALYTALGYQVGQVRPMIEGKAPYDAARVREAAQVVTAIAPLLPGAFPPDSNLPGKTAAKPEVWSEWPQFSQRLKALADAGGAFAAAAALDGDAASVRPAFEALTRECKGCHERYKREH